MDFKKYWYLLFALIYFLVIIIFDTVSMFTKGVDATTQLHYDTMIIVSFFGLMTYIDYKFDKDE